MKFFDEVEQTEQFEPVVQQSKVYFQKKGLLRSVGDFSIEVLKNVEKWLFSFPSGMTKEAFNRQLGHLDVDEAIALGQLEAAHGFRVIKKRKLSYPKVPLSFIQCVANDRLFITINGSKSNCEKYVVQALKDLKPYGSVYVLDCALLFAEYKSSRERGGADERLSAAHKCDFLIVENLAQSIGYVSNAACWSLVALVNARVELRKPMLLRHNDYRNLKPLYEKCPVYSVDDCGE